MSCSAPRFISKSSLNVFLYLLIKSCGSSHLFPLNYLKTVFFGSSVCSGFAMHIVSIHPVEASCIALFHEEWQCEISRFSTD